MKYLALLFILALTATSCIGPIVDVPPSPGGCGGHHGSPFTAQPPYNTPPVSIVNP